MQTGLSAWVFAIAQALEDAGVDYPATMREIGMDPEKIGDLTHRYSQDQVTSLWIAAGKATRDETFGLKVAKHIRPSTFHVVGYAMTCSATLRRAGERFARYSRIISDAAKVGFEPVDGGIELSVELNPKGHQPIYHTIDTILAGFHMLGEWILREPIAPVRVMMRHSAPASVQPYEAVFHCPVLFGQSRNCIVYGPDVVEKPIPSANEELAHVLDEMAANHINRRRSHRFSAKVREALIAQLPKGFPSRKMTASMLGVTERTLLRRLADEDTTFQDVLEALREALSFDYLRRPDLTTEEIAFLLGFSSNSSFSRAFHRWTGERPSDWRVRRRLEGAEPFDMEAGEVED